MIKKVTRFFTRMLYLGLSRVPGIGMLIKRWKINKNFSLERKVLKGKHHSSSTRPSILLFSIYRAGSTFSGSIMKRIAQDCGLTAVNLDGYFYNLGKGKEWEGKGRVMLKVPYRSQGYYYGPFRSFNRGISKIEDYKIILILRDPRDVLVSSYYATYSHVTPLLENQRALEKRMNRRKKQLEQSVEEFVINKLSANSRFLNRYYEYYNELMGKPNVLFLKYEDMVENFNQWIDDLTDFLDMEISDQLLKQIKEESNFKVSKENVYKHKRQVTPGDHRRKLKPETISVLNSKTEEIRTLFDYRP